VRLQGGAHCLPVPTLPGLAPATLVVFADRNTTIDNNIYVAIASAIVDSAITIAIVIAAIGRIRNAISNFYYKDVHSVRDDHPQQPESALPHEW